MTIEQTVEIPPSRRITLTVPREVPAGNARVFIQFPVKKEIPESIGDIRLLLRKEMAEQGTLSAKATAGDGWEAHARERGFFQDSYGKS